MENHLLTKRYLIEKEIASTGNSILFLAYDSLKEKEVLLTNAVFPALGKPEKSGLHAYYEGLESNFAKFSWEFLCPFSDFYETSFSKLSSLEKQSITNRLPGLSLLHDSTIFSFVSSPLNEEKILGEISAANKPDWKKYFLYTLQALSYLHEKGIYYYNMSPFSILYKEERVCLANVGIVPPGHLYFLPSCYAAPEILNHEAEDSRCDIYSLGAVFYHLITGQLYDSQKKQESSFSDVPQEWKEILIQCLQESPQNRFHDTYECAEKASSLFGEKNTTLDPRRFLLNTSFKPDIFHEAEKKIFAFEEKEECLLYFIDGKAGKGKTSFLDQIQQTCLKQGHSVLRASCSLHPCHPLLPFITILEKLGEGFKEEPGFTLTAPLYRCFSLEETHQHIRKQIANALLNKANHPFFLLLDDLQWASKETLDMIKYLLVFCSKQETKSKLRIVASYHKEANNPLERFLEKLSQEPWYSSVGFYSLGESQDSKRTALWVTHSLGMVQPPLKFIGQLSQATENNIVYIQTILLTFLQKKILYREHSEWCIAENSSEDLRFPGSFQDALRNYISTLPQESIDLLYFLCLSNPSVPLDSLLGYSKAKNIQGVLWLWQMSRDKIIRIEENLMVSFASSSFWNHCHSYLVSQKELLPEKLESLETFWQSNLLSFPFVEISSNPGKVSSYYKKIFANLAFLGLEDALEKYLEQYLSLPALEEMLSDPKEEAMQETLLVAEIAFFLKMQTIANYYFEKVQKKAYSPLALARLYEIALWDGNYTLAEEYGKALEKEENILYRIFFLYLDAQKKYRQKEEKNAWKNFQKALELCQSGLRESKEKEILFSLYCHILQNKAIQSRAGEIESGIQLALDIALSLGKTHSQIKLYALLALCCKQKANYKKSWENFQKSLELSEKFSYPSARIEALSGLCEIYTILGSYKKADAIFSQCLHAYKIDKVKGYMSKITLMKARLDSLKNKEKAQELYQEAIQAGKKYHDDESIALAFLGWSEWLMSRNLQEATTQWQESKAFCQSLAYPFLEIYSGVVQAKIKLAGEENPDAVRDLLKQLLLIAQEKNHREFLWQIYACYAESYIIQGNTQEALRFLEISRKVLNENVQMFSDEIQENYKNSSEVKQFFRRMSSLNVELSGENFPQETSGSTGKKSSKRIPAVEDSMLPYQQEVVQKHWNMLREENNHLKKLLEINKNINTEHNLRKLLDMIMDTAIEITKAERGFLILTTTTQEQKAFEVARNFEREDISHPEFEISHSITENTIRTGVPILATDAMQDDRFDGYRSVSDLKLHSLLVVPLKIKDKILGAVYIDNRFEKAIFSEKEKILLEAFADQAAISIENARLFEENQKKQAELETSKSAIEDLNQKLALANAKLSKRIERKEEELKEVKDILQNSQYELESVSRFHNLIGKSKRMQEIFQILDKISDKNIPIFVHGESGTGKELVARAIHFNGNRKEKNFLSENCAAITESLLESELFGHTKGSFTGAYADKKGLFELASSGTLFLDEIGDMSPNMQAKLLRVLETNKIRRVGGKDEISIDVRIVSASNKSLVDLVSKGMFREDLFFRLRVVQIDLPPLRERKEDIPLLIEHFLAEYARENKTHPRNVDKKTLAFLMNYHWPGNIREMKNTIYNVLSLYDEDVLTIANFKDLNPSTAPKSTDFLSQELSIDDYAKLFVLHNQDKYNDSHLARILGFSRKTLWEKRKKWGILKG
ncbi:MAG: sigma 54-interacting transcriptional regulator [Candidatus Brocadiae bacterium]|nr:sigma 54-interacting transcriptional regulator [Candidatus Brocadiia bacterium]